MNVPEFTDLSSFYEFLGSDSTSPNAENSTEIEQAYEFLNDVELCHAMRVDSLVDIAIDEKHLSIEEQERAFAEARYHADKLNEYREAVKTGDRIVITWLKYHNQKASSNVRRRRFDKHIAFQSSIISDIEGHKLADKN